jgi:hypothetical protein
MVAVVQSLNWRHTLFGVAFSFRANHERFWLIIHDTGGRSFDDKMASISQPADRPVSPP